MTDQKAAPSWSAFHQRTATQTQARPAPPPLFPEPLLALLHAPDRPRVTDAEMRSSMCEYMVTETLGPSATTLLALEDRMRRARDAAESAIGTQAAAELSGEFRARLKEKLATARTATDAERMTRRIAEIDADESMKAAYRALSPAARTVVDGWRTAREKLEAHEATDEGRDARRIIDALLAELDEEWLAPPQTASEARDEQRAAKASALGEQIYKLVKRNGEMTREDVRRATGKSDKTVRDQLDILERAERIEKFRRPGRGGQAPYVYRVRDDGSAPSPDDE